MDCEQDSVQQRSRKKKKKEGRRRAKPIDRTNINAEELEYQRLLSEVCIMTLCYLISTIQNHLDDD